jgi:hypothetical protein
MYRCPESVPETGYNRGRDCIGEDRHATETTPQKRILPPYSYSGKNVDTLKDKKQ